MEEYQEVIRSVTFEHIGGNYQDEGYDGDDPYENDRTIEVQVEDTESNDSNTVERDIFVNAINDAPELNPYEDTITYEEGSGAQVIDADIDLFDIDDDNMSGAVIQITEGYREGEDFLNFTETSHISGTWDASTGTLTLTGSASENEYQTAIQSVTYENRSEDPELGSRHSCLHGNGLEFEKLRRRSRRRHQIG